ncbi:imidazoleglycerol-phosphate dehydratase HisB [Candidatus Vidania fulgoroideorum]
MTEDFVYERKTKETSIKLRINFSNSINTISINTGISFLDHLLMQTSFHGCFSTVLDCVGDINVDSHHTVEDIGIVYGKLFRKIFKARKSCRYNFAYVPFDDSLTRMVLDISERPYLVFNVNGGEKGIKGITVNNILEFFKSFSNNSKTTIHIENYGYDRHHRMESIFKCFGVLLKRILETKKNNKVSSTKSL